MNLFNALRRLYHSTKVGRVILRPFKLLLNAVEFNYWTDRKHIISQFQSFHNCKPNIDQPKTFSEKLQWLKLHDRTHLHTKCADKYGVRSYVGASVGNKYLIPLLATFNSPDELTFSDIPESALVIKTNHDSGTVIIVKDKASADIAQVRLRLSLSMKINFYHSSREWQYKNIVPKIVVEKYLSNSNGDVPKDYKIHCFAGKPHFIQVDSNRFTHHGRAFYDTHWSEQPFALKFPHVGGISRPDSLDEMLGIAAVLSAPFRFARIDLYECAGRVYFGEITFHPGSGYEVFEPLDWDRKFGDCLRL